MVLLLVDFWEAVENRMRCFRFANTYNTACGLWRIRESDSSQ